MSSFIFEIVTSAVLVGGFYFNNISIIAFALASFIACISLGQMDRKVCTLLYFVSWGLVMKLDMSSTSFYTIGLILAITLMIIEMLIKNRSIDIRLFILYLSFGGYVLISTLANGGSIDILVRYLINCTFFIYVSLYCKIEHYDKYVLAYCLGVLTSGITGLFLNYLGDMSYNIRFDTLVQDGERINRFVGLNWDPNFFGLQVITCTGLLLNIFTYNRKPSYILLMAGLAILGFMTISKTYMGIFFLQLLVYTVFLGFTDIKKNVKILYVLLGIAVLVLVNFDKWFSLYIDRMSGLENQVNFLDELTTGRISIWDSYLDRIFSSIQGVLLGVGIGFGSASHNLYISSIYLFGIFGSLIFVSFAYRFYQLMGNTSDREHLFINYLPIMSTAIYFFTLDGFLELYFIPQLILLIMAMRYRQVEELVGV